MINEIINNPYRILGVYSNSSKKEQLANKGKLQAFLKVKKSMSFPADMVPLLPPLNRTNDMVNEASAKLTLVGEQIKYAQFWFICATPLDEVAFSHLVKGNIKEARAIWSKVTNMSSLQNQFVLELICSEIYDQTVSPLLDNIKEWKIAYDKLKEQGICGKVEDAINKFALPLFDDYVDEFVAAVSDTRSFTKIDFMHNIVDTLYEDHLSYRSDTLDIQDKEWLDYIISKRTQEIIERIEEHVAQSKDPRISEGTDAPKWALVIGESIASSSKHSLNTLKALVGEESSQYIIMADKVAMSVIDCMVAYYNRTKDNDRAAKALPLCVYACEVAKGAVAQKRAQENHKTVKHAFDNLPPKEVRSYAGILDDIFKWFDKQSHTSENSYLFLEKSRNTLVRIKSVLGKTHEFYLETASELGSAALSYVIDEINSIMEIYDKRTSSYSNVIPLNKLSKRNQERIKKASAFNQDRICLHCIFEDAWKAMSYIQLLDKTSEFNKRFLENYQIFTELVRRLNFDFSSNITYYLGHGEFHLDEIDSRFFYTEDEYYNSCSRRKDFESYAQRFPKGKFIEQAKSQIQNLFQQEESQYNSCKSIQDFRQYLDDYPDGDFREEANENIIGIHNKNRKLLLVTLIILFFVILAAYIFTNINHTSKQQNDTAIDSTEVVSIDSSSSSFEEPEDEIIQQVKNLKPNAVERVSPHTNTKKSVTRPVPQKKPKDDVDMEPAQENFGSTNNYNNNDY